MQEATGVVVSILCCNPGIALMPSAVDHPGATIEFTKMHGLGNDYVYVDCFQQSLDGVDVSALAVKMSDRHRGIGADGLILIRPPATDSNADVTMEMYNADGSRGEMCGNGIRCVAKYALEHGLVSHDGGETTDLRIMTDRGVLTLRASLRDGRVDQIRVDMGPPLLKPAEIGVRERGERCVSSELPANCRSLLGTDRYRMTCVSMGNPHAVLFVDSLGEIDLAQLGPVMERDAVFSDRINVHVAAVLSRCEVRMRTWERGTGLTQACGTGACAVLVAGVLEDRLDRKATVHLPGGDLEVEWSAGQGGDLGAVFKTGPATEVFSGHWPV
jgi:diaminopimelate epimerase